jgi:hypothetical protein
MTNDPVLAELDAEIQRIQDELTTAQGFRSWWLSRHGGQRETPILPPADLDRGLTVKEWVMTVLSNGAKMGPAEIARAAQSLGWVTTSKSPAVMVRNNLKLLEEKGEVVRRDGKYMLSPNVTGPRWSTSGENRAVEFPALNGARAVHAEESG